MKRILYTTYAMLLSIVTYGQAKLSQDSAAGANLQSSPSIQWSRNLLYGKPLYYMYDAKSGKTLPIYSAQLANYIFLGKDEAARMYQPIGAYAPAAGSSSYIPYIGAVSDIDLNGKNISTSGKARITDLRVGDAATTGNTNWTSSVFQALQVGMCNSIFSSKIGSNNSGIMGLAINYYNTDTSPFYTRIVDGYPSILNLTGSTMEVAFGTYGVAGSMFGSSSLTNALHVTTDGLSVPGYIRQGSVISALLKTDAFGYLVPAIPGTDYVAPGSYLTQTTADARYPILSGSYANPSWIASLAYSKLTGVPSNVSTFSNDAGYQTQASSDMRYPQLAGNYANPAWITALAYSKLTGAPTLGTLAAKNNGDVLASSITGNAATASNSTQLNGQPGSYYYAASNPNGFYKAGDDASLNTVNLTTAKR